MTSDDPVDWTVPLDETFVTRAPVREASADERRAEAEARRRAAELRIRLFADEATATAQALETRRQRQRRALAIATATIAIGTLVVVFNQAASTDVTHVHLASGDALRILSPIGPSQPTPGIDAEPNPIGSPPPTPSGRGEHRFLHLQPESTKPVAYDPCRPIRYVVNPFSAPRGGFDLLNDAIEQIETATGLEFIDDGRSDESYAPDRLAFQPSRYGDRWVPVLIEWSTPSRAEDLVGNVAGFAGSVFAGDPSGLAYVTGVVVLDGPDLAEIARNAGPSAATAVIVHEFGHLVGLDHVDDPTQLMHPTTSETSALGAGDRRGLSRLGRGNCFPDL